MNSTNILSVLGYAGVGSLLAAAVQSFTGRKESKAHAANMVVESSTGFAAQVASDNERLVEDNRQLRKSLVALSDAMDVLLTAVDKIGTPGFANSTPHFHEAREVARVANNVAKIIL